MKMAEEGKFSFSQLYDYLSSGSYIGIGRPTAIDNFVLSACRFGCTISIAAMNGALTLWQWVRPFSCPVKGCTGFGYGRPATLSPHTECLYYFRCHLVTSVREIIINLIKVVVNCTLFLLSQSYGIRLAWISLSLLPQLPVGTNI